MSATEPATCIMGLDSATLSAARDDLLPPDQLARVRAHTPACDACQACIAGFDAVAQALRTQRELEPGDRIVRAVQLVASPTSVAQSAPQQSATQQLAARQAGPPRLPGSTRSRLWGGVAALSAVAALVLLFVYVLGGGLGLRGKPSAQATPVRSPAIVATPHTTPRATPTPFPTTPVIDARQAWGTGGVAARFSTQLDATHVFEPKAIMPDGRTLLGSEYPVNGDGTLDVTGLVRVGMLDVVTRQFTPFGVDASVNYPPIYVANDGRFVIVADDTQPGATCGICHRRDWSYDLVTHQLRKIGTGVGFMRLDHGVAILVPVLTQTTAIEADDLATGTITPIATGSASQSPQLLGFGWPYVLYANEPAGGATGSASAPVPVRAHDLRTGADVALPQLDGGPLTAFGNAITTLLTLQSDTLIYVSASATPSGARTTRATVGGSSCPQCTPTPGPPPPAPPSFTTTVFALDHFPDPAAHPRPIGTLPVASGDAVGIFAAGDTVFVSIVPDNAIPGSATAPQVIFAVSHASDPATRALVELASGTWLAVAGAANQRLVVFGGSLVFDRAEERLVNLAPVSTPPSRPSTDLAGDFLLVVLPTSLGNSGVQQVTIYNTTLLATQPAP